MLSLSGLYNTLIPYTTTLTEICQSDLKTHINNFYSQLDVKETKNKIDELK